MCRRIVFCIFVFALLFVALTQCLSHHSFPVYAQEKVANKSTTNDASQSKAEDCDTSPIAGLNEGIQFRFQEVDNNFNVGIRRVIRARTRYHMYRSENYAQRFSPYLLQEVLAIDQLEQESWKVGFFLVGRSILEEKPEKSLWEDPNSDYYKRKPINNPLLMTRTTVVDELPTAWELWDEAKKALQMFEATANQNRYEFRHGEWTVAARPIRAGQQDCLRCHLGNEKLAFTGRAVIALPSDLNEAAKNQENNDSPSQSKLKIGDPLGVALYAYKQSLKE